jgi:hypothetical protein
MQQCATCAPPHSLAPWHALAAARHRVAGSLVLGTLDPAAQAQDDDFDDQSTTSYVARPQAEQCARVSSPRASGMQAMCCTPYTNHTSVASPENHSVAVALPENLSVAVASPENHSVAFLFPFLESVTAPGQRLSVATCVTSPDKTPSSSPGRALIAHSGALGRVSDGYLEAFGTQCHGVHASWSCTACMHQMSDGYAMDQMLLPTLAHEVVSTF